MKKFCRKGHLKRSGKRWLALLMSVCLIGTMIPITARAENGSTETGLCEHHTEHTTECGYAAPAQGHECGHVHDESCGYQEASECTHVHTEECGENGENCTHVHTSECGYAEGHACEHVHDEECGYAEASEGSPCTFVCDICGKEAEPEQTEGKLITSWQWIDEEEYLDEETGNLALPGASEQTPAYFDDVISFLPTQIQATVVNADDSENPETGVEETITLGDWSCDSYPEEGAYSGNYTFSVALPEGYALSEEAEALTVLVELGGAQMWYDSGSLGDGLYWTLNDDGTLTICGKGNIPDANQWWDGQATSVKEIVIEEGVTGIGDMGLCQCTNLTSVTIPSTVTSIGKNAFLQCKSLTTVSFADECVSTLSIGGGAFYGCTALESIEIPDYVTTMGISTFRDCSSLQSVTFKEGSQLNAISDYAFYGCSALTSIVIPESVTTLGTGIFDYCSNLNKVTCVSGSSAESYLSSNYPDIPIARLYKLKLDLGATEGYTITQADKTALPGSGLLLTDGDGSLSFRIEAAYGYNKNFTVKADGTEMTAVDGVYTISGITENKTIALTIEGAGQCSHNYNNGFCTKCDAYDPAVYNESQYYYEINNAGQLYWFAGLVNGDENICTGIVSQNTSANAVLKADITVNSGLTEDKGLLQSLSYDSDGNVINGDSFISWTPIGNYSNSYTGTFDGQGFTVSGLYVNNTDSNTGGYVGLFGYVGSDGKVSKVGVVDSYFNAYWFVGGVCGFNKGGNITECYNKGTVNGTDRYIGGVCGDNSSGTIQNCYNEGSVTGKNERTGGVCGGNENASIINCYNTGKVAGRTGCGGVCGNNYTGGTIQNCYNIGTVSFSTTDTTGAIGGVCGYNKSTITNCYFDSDKYTGTAVGATGDGSNVSDNVIGKTTEQFASGEVAYLLNGSSSENSIWYQNIDNGTEDAYPVLDSGHGIVYQCTNCTGTYSNTENKSAAHRFEMVDDTNHKCKNCGLVAEHSTATLTYTADEDTNEITVKCGDDCGKEYGTVTLRKPTGTLTYDGNAKEAVISNDVTGITISNPDITYKQDGNTLSSAPKDAGTYTASITLGAATVSVEFIIARATPQVTNLPTVAARTYNPTVSLTNDDLTGGTVNVSGSWSWQTANIIPTVNNNGYVAVFTPTDSTNYETVTKTITVTVTKATPYIATVPTADAITYGDTLGASTLSGGTVQYSSSDATTVAGSFVWANATVKPTVADSNTKTYRIVFTPSDADNYNTAETDITLTVNKAGNAPNKPSSTMNVANSCEKVSDVTLPTGWVWQDADKNTELTVGTAVTATAEYNGADKGNYVNETVSVSITRSACDHAHTEVRNAKAATCKETGYTGDTYCKDCGELLTTGTTIPLADHQGGTATCTKKAVCTVCGQEYGELDANNHVHTEIRGAVAATCTAGGYTGDTYCTDCGVKIKTGTATPALGHNYTSKVTTEPTTDREGVRTYTCDRCGHSYTESIPKLPEEPHEHSYSGSVTKEATCTDTGVRTYTCSCGDSYTETIPALGHSYTSKVTKEPTTSSEGVMTYTCDRCGHSYTRAIAKLQDNNNPGENQPGGENTPDIGKPYIKDETGKEGWEVIKAEVDKTKAGDTVTVEMNGSAVVPGNVLDEIKGKDADIVFDMGGGITWSVNGQSITSDKIGDIDFSVTIGTTTIPTDVINNVTGERQSKQISLAYDGEFGFTAVLSINMEASNAGMYANLYYYNEKTGELEFICADKIAEDGTAELTFTHASDYVIAIDTEPMDKLEQVTEPESESQSTEAESTQTGAEVSNDAWNPWWIIVIGIMVIVIGLGVFLVAKKKKEDELE